MTPRRWRVIDRRADGALVPRESEAVLPLRARKSWAWQAIDIFADDVPPHWRDAVIAVVSLCHEATGTDENGVAINYEMRQQFVFPATASDRLAAHLADLKAHLAADKALYAFLETPLAAMAQRLSARDGAPFWMNAPLITAQWIEDGCPGMSISLAEQGGAAP